MRSRVALGMVLALLAGGAGGCADGEVKEANSYVAAVNDAQQAFATRSEELRDKVDVTQPGSQGRAALRDFYAAVDDFAGRLRAIDPPAAVRSLHEKLIGSIVRFGTSLRKAGSDIGSGNAGRILDGQEELSNATASVGRSINATIAAINDALRS
ncbi:MAG: hypothetical protein ACJ762_07570 [Solirubrobacteraceae bacterium]